MTPDRTPDRMPDRTPDRSRPVLIVPDLIVPDLIVLAGGRGSRLGGAAKPTIAVAGRTLLSRALDARALAGRTVVVGPESSRPAAGAAAGDVLWALEDPPLGGPVAGLAAGLAALDGDALDSDAAAASGAEPGAGPGSRPGSRPADWVLLLACDLPWAADAARILLAAAEAEATATATATAVGETAASAQPGAGSLGAIDGIHLVDADGRAQWLTGLYRVTALREAVRLAGAEVRGASVRGLLGGLRLRGIRDESNAGRDVDTWQDVAATEAILNPPPACDPPPVCG